MTREFPKILAHRGGASFGQDNSLEAVRATAACGCEGVEIDVLQLRDGTLLASHDSAVHGGTQWMSELTFDELVAGPNHRPQLLTELLDVTFALGMTVYLDLKSISPASIMVLVNEHHAHVREGRLIFASARGDILSTIERSAPEAWTSYLFYDPLFDVRSLEGHLKPHFVHPCFDYLRDPFKYFTSEYVARIRQHGFSLVTWNEVNPERFERLRNLDVDWICTDNPSLNGSGGFSP